ncbi:hypothetical protein AgCh_022742 [Apium graveolens]
MERLRRELRFDGMLTVNAQGRSGGLALLWKMKDQVTLRSLSRNHIDVEVCCENKGRWRLTGIYGEPDRAQRRKTWDLLRNLARDSNLPWCTIGDMNNITSQMDKNGGALYPNYLIEGFNTVLAEVGLIDMELVGHQFTWEKGRGTNEWMEIRLDRALISGDWLQLFPLAKLYNLEVTSSDHSPILLIPQVSERGVRKRKFRFENAWLTEPMCRQLVMESWEEGKGENIQEKVKICSQQLDQWGKEITSKFSSRIKSCKLELKKLRKRKDSVSVERYKEIKGKLFVILEQKEIFWRQRSKQLWLHSGDKNTRFFHAAASDRRRSNKIQKLKNGEGEWIEWGDGLEEHITAHFNHLFTATQSSWQEVVECIENRVTLEQNEELLKQITEEEVRRALFQMNPDKAPGPDGFTPAFYQKHWDIVGHDIVQMVDSFFQEGVLPEGINETNIVLIPKKKQSTQVGDLRPISLCNILIKIITKILANRMKHILDGVVSECQSAFIPGRLITDNIMVAYEMNHYLKRKRRGRGGCMAIKMDMSKAYDRIEWEYLREVLSKLGFHDWWVKLILQCVTSVSYSVTHGNSEMGPIIPSRGLRQGDPLSPYLFILCAEGLSALINRRESQGLIHGIKICRQAPSISHLLFADDSYLFCTASDNEAMGMADLLQTYEEASSQRVNVSKSSVFFSTNVRRESRSSICRILQMDEADDNSTYLGLPSLVGRNKSSVLGFLKDKVKNRIQSWKNRWVSQAGREVLIKNVVQALPTYAMSVFLLPVEIIQDFERCLTRYWWSGSTDTKKGIHWMAWDRMNKHKSTGGLGFRDFHDFNLALLGKQGWRFISRPKTLVSRVYKARYFSKVHFLDAELGNNPSFIWRSVWEAKGVVRDGVRWNLGSGETVAIRNQPWLQDKENPYISSELEGMENATVSS